MADVLIFVGSLAPRLREIARHADGLCRIVICFSLQLRPAQDLADDLQLHGDGLPRPRGGKVTDECVDLFGGNAADLPCPKFVHGSAQRRLVVFHRVRLELRLGFIPPLLCDPREGRLRVDLRLQLGSVKRLDLFPYFLVGFPAEGLALAVDAEDRLMQTVRSDVIAGIFWHCAASSLLNIPVANRRAVAL